jgi:hypothetical protein
MMRRQLASALCAVVLGVTALSSVVAAEQKTADNARSDGDQRTYLTIKDLMQSIVDPSADAVWGAVGTVADKQGLRDLSPKTPQEWLEVRRAGVRLVEGANLLMMPDREAAAAGVQSDAPGVELEPAEITALIRKDRASFEAFAMALQAVSVDVLQAVETKNTALLIEVGGRMEEVCESCHQTFWYPHEQTPTRRP